MTVAGVGFREKRARSQELLEAVGLWERRKHRLAQLSGGQQQRVAIATALANRPKLLLADEPTGEVDSATAHGILALFQELNQSFGLTTIIVTHDQQIARQVDRVVAIRDGRTSSETVRVERRAIRGERRVGRGDSVFSPPSSPILYSEYVVVDSAGRLQVPKEYLEQVGVGDRATLEVTEQGIVIRPVAGRQRRVSTPLLDGLEEELPVPHQRGVRRLWARVRGQSATSPSPTLSDQNEG
jgi:energy-coupling factor transporter ATP-binding protein EcfA2